MNKQNETNTKLVEIFENVNKWLHFAEAKNGAVLALLSLVFFRLFSYAPAEIENSNIYSKIFFISIIILFILSFLFSAFSFLPNLKKTKGNYIKEDFKVSHLNLLFFGDIAKYSSPQHYLNDFLNKYFDNKEEALDKYLLDLIDEIIINSQITNKKFWFFKKSLIFLIIGFISFICYYFIFNI
jgi:hypothetical protein